MTTNAQAALIAAANARTSDALIMASAETFKAWLDKKDAADQARIHVG